MKEKIKKIIIPVMILVFIGTGIWWYQYNQSARKYCLKKCEYDIAFKAWGYYGGYRLPATTGQEPERYFPTQEQCIDYCLTVK